MTIECGNQVLHLTFSNIEILLLNILSMVRMSSYHPQAAKILNTASQLLRFNARLSLIIIYQQLCTIPDVLPLNPNSKLIFLNSRITAIKFLNSCTVSIPTASAVLRRYINSLIIVIIIIMVIDIARLYNILRNFHIYRNVGFIVKHLSAINYASTDLNKLLKSHH